MIIRLANGLIATNAKNPQAWDEIKPGVYRKRMEEEQ